MPLSLNRKKSIRTVSILVLIVLTLFPVSRTFLFERHLFNIVDSTATEYVDQGLKRAATAFAMARTFNAIVSVFQESELQLEPAGVGVSLALGQALDPVNDLVERFSWVMLASLTSLGIQKVLIQITPLLSVQILLLALLSFLAGLWLPSIRRADFTQLGRILLFSAILLRFAVPAMAYVNHHVYVAFLEDRHNQSVKVLGQTISELESQRLSGFPESAEEERWWKSMSDLPGIADVKAKIEAIKKTALEMIDKIIDLIVVFVLSTIALPLLFLWGVIKLGRLIFVQGFSVVAGERPAEK